MANQEITIGAASGAVPPPVTDAEKTSIFKLLTTKRSEARFEEKMSRPDEAEINRITSIMESDPDYFITIVGHKNGCMRVYKLLGVSDEANGHLCKAIANRFVEIMKDSHACNVAAQAMMVLDQDRQRILLELTLFHVVDLAKHNYGGAVVNMIVTKTNYLEYKHQIMDKVAMHAHELSSNHNGAAVVANLLNLNTCLCGSLCSNRSMRLALCGLRGRCVELSFTGPGSGLVDKLLDGTAETVNYVVEEIRSCDDNTKLVRLAKGEFGYYVVRKALEVTARRADSLHLFTPLVHRLRTIRHLLVNSNRGNAIGAILDEFMN